jgi:hypothetical protein
VNWRRLAGATAACLLNVHACRVYDESDLESSSEVIESTGGRAPAASGGGAPPFNGAPTGGSGAAPSGGSSGGGVGAAAAAGRGGAPGTSGGTGGKSAPSAQGGEPDAGDPGSGGAAGSDDAGGEAGGDGSGGNQQQGGAPSGGTPAGGASGGSVTATGGSATGGSPPIAPELIDDCEDRNNRIRINQGRNGYWSTFDAGTGCTLSPSNSTGNMFMADTEDGSGTGRYALHFVSSGGTDGCGITLEFLSPKELYDASDYVGISFGARSEDGNKETLVKIAVAGTDPDFGLCGTECYDHFETTVLLGENWDEHVVRFEDLAQVGWGFDAGDFDASNVVAIQWLAVPGAANIWIDDVKFVGD